MAELAREVKPSDVIEWLWVKDTADLTWDILRYRRIKAAYVDGRFRTALVDRLESLGESAEADYESDGADGENDEASGADDEADRESNDPESLANQWFTEREMKTEIDDWLKQSGSDTEVMFAKAFVQELEELSVIESMLISAESRRNEALREIERRRSISGRALRQTSDRIIAREAPLVPLAAK